MDEFQDKNVFMIHNDLINSIWNQITDIIEEFYLPLPGKLDGGTWMNYIPLPFVGDNDITVTLQNSIINLGG